MMLCSAVSSGVCPTRGVAFDLKVDEVVAEDRKEVRSEKNV